MKKIISVALILILALSLCACSGSETLVCASCDEECSAEAAFCSNCGNSMIKKCPACETVCSPSDAFCADCGTALKQDSEVNSDTNSDSTASNSLENSENTDSSSVGSSENASSDKTEDAVKDPDPSQIWLEITSTTAGSGAIFRYTYDYYGREIASEVLPDDGSGTVLIRWTTTYDANGFPCAHSTKNDLFNSHGSGTYRVETVETPKGTRMSVKIRMNESGTETDRTVYTYNDAGQLTESTDYSGTTLSARYEYDPATEKVLKEYNSKNLLSKEYFYNEQGSRYKEIIYTDGVATGTATYTLDHNGNPAKRSYTSDSNSTETTYVYQSLERYRIENNLTP